MEADWEDLDLCKAAQEGNLQKVRVLLKSGADVNQTDRNELSALYRAASKGHAEVIQMLLEAGARLDAGIRSPLFTAMHKGYREAVTLLYRAADGNRRLLSGRIRFSYRCRITPQWNDQAPPYTNLGECSCMQFAAINNLVPMVSLLAHLGEDVNHLHNGYTALHVSAAHCVQRARVVHELLTLGADPKIPTKYKATALRYAAYQPGKPYTIKKIVRMWC